jgi:hypothetical protein
MGFSAVSETVESCVFMRLRDGVLKKITDHTSPPLEKGIYYCEFLKKLRKAIAHVLRVFVVRATDDQLQWSHRIQSEQTINELLRKRN